MHRQSRLRLLVVPFVLLAAFLFASFGNRARLDAPQNRQTGRQMTRDQDQPMSEARVALVIGNGAYAKGRLKNPPNDARAMAAALRELDFEATEVIDADKVKIQRAIRDFGKRLKETGGVGLFYYAGHGVQVGGHNYLVPLGAETEVEKEEDVDLYCLDAETVLKQMEGAGGRVNIVIMDACRDNPFSRSFSRDGAGGLAEIKAPSGTLIAYATDPGKTASDGDGDNGLYTQELLARMRQPGLRIEDVFNLAGAEVERKSGRKQQPWISSKLRGAFYFKPPVEAVNPSTKTDRPVDPRTAEQEAWETVKDSTDPEDFREFLRNFPNGGYAGTAKVKLRKLEASVKSSTSTPTGPETSSRPPVSKPAAPSPGTQIEGAAGIKLVFIPAGEFQMGSENGVSDEKPVHRVVIPEPFWMGKYEVTQAQWESVMGNNPSRFKGQNLPVETVSWDECQEFIRKLNAKGDGNTYALPTEAEWEYACRAGTKDDYAGSSLDTLGWYNKNSGNQTHPVGQKQANAFGLHDTHGNVWEWCADWYDGNFYKRSRATNPTGPESGQYRVLRGGSWFFNADYCRSAFRYGNTPTERNNYNGFRIVVHSSRT
jgi:formylglycine-generating enzyme required for sulfatase activity